MRGYTDISIKSDVSLCARIDVFYQDDQRDFMTVAIRKPGVEEAFIHLGHAHARIVAAAILSAADDVEQHVRRKAEEKGS